MSRGRPPRWGQLSFRLPEETHKELKAVSEAYGQDVSAVVNRIIAEALPPMFETAMRVSRAREEARAAFFRSLLGDKEKGD